MEKVGVKRTKPTKQTNTCKQKPAIHVVLVSAGIEPFKCHYYFLKTTHNCPGFAWNKVNFLLRAAIVLCFGFQTRRMLITH